MPDYVLKGWDDMGNSSAEFELDAVDDTDAAERAQEEMASGGFDHCAYMELYRLVFVHSYGNPFFDGFAGMKSAQNWAVSFSSGPPRVLGRASTVARRASQTLLAAAPGVIAILGNLSGRFSPRATPFKPPLNELRALMGGSAGRRDLYRSVRAGAAAVPAALSSTVSLVFACLLALFRSSFLFNSIFVKGG